MIPTVWVALAPLVDKTPKENDVVAGWTGFAVFIGLCVATAVLLWSFSRQLRRTRESFGVDRAGRPLDGSADADEDAGDATDQGPGEAHAGSGGSGATGAEPPARS